MVKSVHQADLSLGIQLFLVPKFTQPLTTYKISMQPIKDFVKIINKNDSHFQMEKTKCIVYLHLITDHLLTPMY